MTIRTEGCLDKASVTEMVKDALELMIAKNCTRCLVDHRNLSSVAIGTFDIYNMPRMYSELGLPRNFKIAMVVPQKFLESFLFLETVNRNYGYMFSIHLDDESAQRWLNPVQESMQPPAG